MTEDRELYALRSKVKETNFYLGYYKQLIGAKVVGIQLTLDEEEDYDPLFYDIWPGIIFEKDGNEFLCELSKDEEGNGPGFMFGLNQVSNTEDFVASVDEMNEATLRALLKRILTTDTVEKEK